MSDIVERLNEEGLGFGIGPALLCQEAAAEITRLRADLAAAQEREQRMREATICAAVEEYLLQHPNEGPDERLSRAATMRGMMVRLGLYAEFEQRLDYAVLHSPFRAALGGPNE